MLRLRRDNLEGRMLVKIGRIRIVGGWQVMGLSDGNLDKVSQAATYDE